MITTEQIEIFWNALVQCNRAKTQRETESIIQDAIERYEQSKWVSVADRMPDEWCFVVLRFNPEELIEIGFKNCTYHASYNAPNDGISEATGFYDCTPIDEWHIEPTHWKPLPEFKEITNESN